MACSFHAFTCCFTSPWCLNKLDFNSPKQSTIYIYICMHTNRQNRSPWSKHTENGSSSKLHFSTVKQRNRSLSHRWSSFASECRMPSWQSCLVVIVHLGELIDLKCCSPWWKHECDVLRGLQSSFAEGNILFQSYFELLTGGVREHMWTCKFQMRKFENTEKTAQLVCLRGSALGYHAACYGGKPSQKVQRYLVICLSAVVSPLPKISPLNRCDRFGQGLKWQTRSPTALGKCCSKPRPLGITNAKESSLGRLEIIHSWKMVEPIRGVRWTKIPSIFALNCWVHEKAITLELHP